MHTFLFGLRNGVRCHVHLFFFAMPTDFEGGHSVKKFQLLTMQQLLQIHIIAQRYQSQDLCWQSTSY